MRMREERRFLMAKGYNGVFFRFVDPGKVSVIVQVLLTLLRKRRREHRPQFMFLLVGCSAPRSSRGITMPPASSCTQTVGRYFPPQSSDGVISLDCGQTPYSDFLLVRAIGSYNRAAAGQGFFS